MLRMRSRTLAWPPGATGLRGACKENSRRGRRAVTGRVDPSTASASRPSPAAGSAGSVAVTCGWRLAHPMAGDEVSGRGLDEAWIGRLIAEAKAHRAARVEVAAFGRMGRAGHVTGNDDAVAPVSHAWGPAPARRRAATGCRGAAGSRRVRRRSPAQRSCQVHNRDAVTNVAHHAQVMGDEEVGQIQLFLQVLEQVDDLSLNRDIQRGNRFAATMNFGSSARARAMPMRCRWPPENSCG